MSKWKNCINAMLLLTCLHTTAQKNCNCPEYYKMEKENKFDNGEFVSDTSLYTLLRSSNIICQAMGYELKADYMMVNEKYDSAQYYLSVEEGLYKKSGCNDSVTIRCNYKWYYLYYMQGKYKEALEYQFKNIGVTRRANNYYELAFCYLDISRVFELMGQMQKGMEYCRLAIPYIDKIKKADSKAQACYNLSHRYFFFAETNSNPGLLDTAVKYAGMAIEYGKISHNLPSLINGYYQLAGAAFNQKDYKRALLLNDSSLSLAKSMLNYNMIGANYIDLASIYLAENDFNKARSMGDSCMRYAELYNQPSFYLEAYSKVREIAEKSGDYKLAFEILKKEKDMEDSISSSEKAADINDLEIKYNKLQNESKIKDLTGQRQLYISLSLAALLALTGSVFFIRHQSFKNKQSILETEQRLNRARMNPHFFFNALASLQKFALRDNDAQAMASNLSKFSNIMRETLESTYKEYVTIEQEIDFLSEYLEVQKIRFPQTFSYEVFADKSLEVDELQIPAMIIQPFVENSIEHGFVGVEYAGKITVHFTKDNKELLVQITDNGKGLNMVAKENNEHISRASQIIKDRIYLLNIKLKTKAGFSIGNNAAGNGVIVKIHLPLLYKSETGGQV